MKAKSPSIDTHANAKLRLAAPEFGNGGYIGCCVAKGEHKKVSRQSASKK